MKTKEELLKIYSAYLPYELECEVLKKGMYFPYPNHLSAGRRIILNIDQMPFKIWCNPTNSDWLDILFRDTKLVLYSMDMLTKEIEHKGERFIPIEKLFDIETNLEWSKSGHIKAEKGKDEYWVRQKEEGRSFHFGYNAEKNYFYKIDSENCKQSVWKQLEMFQKLFEWHFNVFGLSESEYIKKESLS